MLSIWARPGVANGTLGLRLLPHLFPLIGRFGQVDDDKLQAVKRCMLRRIYSKGKMAHCLGYLFICVNEDENIFQNFM